MELFSTKEGISFSGGVLQDRIQSEWTKISATILNCLLNGHFMLINDIYLLFIRVLYIFINRFL